MVDVVTEALTIDVVVVIFMRPSVRLVTVTTVVVLVVLVKTSFVVITTV